MRTEKKFRNVKNVDTIAFANWNKFAKRNIKVILGFGATLSCIWYTIHQWDKSLGDVDMFVFTNEKSKAEMKEFYDKNLEEFEAVRIN